MPRAGLVVVAVALVGAAGALAVQACASASCKPGTLLLHVALLDDAPLADTITVSGDDPNAAVSASVAHTPNPSGASIAVEHTDVVVTWPQGYPAGSFVHLTVRALAGGAQLGVGEADVRLDAGCSESALLVSNRGGSD